MRKVSVAEVLEGTQFEEYEIESAAMRLNRELSPIDVMVVAATLRQKGFDIATKQAKVREEAIASAITDIPIPF